MIGWIIFAAWAIGWLGFSVTIARFIQKDDAMAADGPLDAALMVGVAMLVALFWPLVIPGGWVYKKVWGGG